MAGLNGLRGLFYVIVWLFAVVLLGLTAHRLKYTTRLPAGDPLNDGQSFYDPIIAELLATSALTIIWVPFVVHVLSGRADYGFYGTFFGESLGLFCLFVLYLVGAIIATVRSPLSRLDPFSSDREFLVAFLGRPRVVSRIHPMQSAHGHRGVLLDVLDRRVYSAFYQRHLLNSASVVS
ncbi:hypothetical protein NLI96_g6677 [Meripilus lineatus]|uniref:Uncharacterized protein n=1 Tax=Meripilus lineatus TaxID=2056292 RepID=A0AAD5YHV9_9APHY|nr:hypothetical protein NLI96_g6677 [Physisporinus lineatus]